MVHPTPLQVFTPLMQFTSGAVSSYLQCCCASKSGVEVCVSSVLMCTIPTGVCSRINGMGCPSF